MKNLYRKIILATALCVTINSAFCETANKLNVACLPYLQYVYKMLGDDFSTVEKKFSMTYVDKNTGNLSRKSAITTIDFSVSDLALSRSDLEARKLIQFPSMVTAIVPVINIPGIDTDKLILDGPVLAAIFSGEISTWNHDAIKALNPHISLPPLKIKPYARSEPSGATLAMTRYLAQKSQRFAKTTGAGELPAWWTGVQLLTKDEAIETTINKIPGAITYVEMDVGNMKHLKFIRLRHASGSVVKADVGFLRQGVVSSRTIENEHEANYLDAVDFGNNWPILLPIYITIPRKSMDDERTSLILRFLFWTFNKGDDTIEQSGLVPLPVLLQSKAVKTIRNVQSSNGKILFVDFDL
ncbi:substrate-binding domain-containing protein [Undibacterium sp. RuTC16W]|uniref:substrate-binding domain-containing protein n=1 Tax=Undibacterium sp. RuTC16W TaxID=3413048 RepID=UPI003BF3DA6B